MRGSGQRTYIGHPKILSAYGIYKPKEQWLVLRRKHRLTYLGSPSIYAGPNNCPPLKDANPLQRLQGACRLADPHGAGMQPVCI